MPRALTLAPFVLFVATSCASSGSKSKSAENASDSSNEKACEQWRAAVEPPKGEPPDFKAVCETSHGLRTTATPTSARSSADVSFEKGSRAEAIGNAVLDQSTSVKKCYQAKLVERPELHGRVEVHFRALANGVVDDVRLARLTIDDCALAECIVDAVAKMKMPRGDAPAPVNVPYVLMPSPPAHCNIPPNWQQ